MAGDGRFDFTSDADAFNILCQRFQIRQFDFVDAD